MPPALVIIFNHKFDQNISKLIALYEKRFKNIFFLVPFYTGQHPQVIPVYENSFCFQGYVAQAASRLKKGAFSHYLFIADDLILDPRINEDTVLSFFGVERESSFFPGFTSLDRISSFWSPVADATRFHPCTPGITIEKELPSIENARRHLARHGITVGPVHYRSKYPAWRWPITKQALLHDMNLLLALCDDILHKNVLQLRYPLTGGYSDVFIVSSSSFEAFSHYCGIFAAAGLFVEIALPTALAFSAEHIVTEKELPLKGVRMWSEEQKRSFVDRYEANLDKLLDAFPPETLYIHPVKLSTWKKNGT